MKKRLIACLSLAIICFFSSLGQNLLTAGTPSLHAAFGEVLAIRITGIEMGPSAIAADGKSAALLSFGGHCDNDFFRGTVLPGAYDCQRSDGEKLTLSARYMLEGVDCKGDSCRIFIENNAVAGSALSTPKIITDSQALAFLNDSELVGFLDTTGPFTIRILAPVAKFPR